MPQGSSRLRRRWTLAFLVGEVVGFVPPAVTGATLASLEAGDLVLVIGLTMAGLFEGLAIGVAQARVLGAYEPSINGRDWVKATVVAAGLAWFLGMGGSAVMGSGAASPALLVLLIPAWFIGLTSMGFLQWLVLRRVVPDSFRWVWVTSGAWVLGVMIPVVALSAVPNGWPAWVHVVVGMVSAVMMGITVGVLTGRTLGRLLGV